MGVRGKLILISINESDADAVDADKFDNRQQKVKMCANSIEFRLEFHLSNMLNNRCISSSTCNINKCLYNTCPSTISKFHSRYQCNKCQFSKCQCSRYRYNSNSSQCHNIKFLFNNNNNSSSSSKSLCNMFNIIRQDNNSYSTLPTCSMKTKSEQFMHLKEHLNVPIDTSNMSEQELQFHYFKMHDADNNNKLDGCELIKSLIHWHEQGHHHDPVATQLPPEQRGSKLFSDQELISLIDPILSMDDTNRDGFIDYPEFVQAQHKAAATQQVKA
ncbi:hypothetical protein B566_EDAN008238 [Ephemera danica]|nr:hypothetical protein B566_EDAN008238 [Ephemera danica]